HRRVRCVEQPRMGRALLAPICRTAPGDTGLLDRAAPRAAAVGPPASLAEPGVQWALVALDAVHCTDVASAGVVHSPATRQAPGFLQFGYGFCITGAWPQPAGDRVAPRPTQRHDDLCVLCRPPGRMAHRWNVDHRDHFRVAGHRDPTAELGPGS